MLQELYNELNEVFGKTSNSSGSSGIITMPQSSGGVTTVFIERSDKGCWYVLEDDERDYISEDSGIRGRVSEIKVELYEPEGYEASQKLKVYIAAESTTYMLWTGVNSSFGKSLIKGLNTLTYAELQDVVIGVTPSKDTKGKGAKVVFANVVLPDGSWKRSDGETPIDTQLSQLRQKLGLKEDAPQPIRTQPVPVSPNLADIPF